MTIRTSALRGGAVITLALVSAWAAADGGDDRTVRAQLSGYQEVPVVSTTGSGSFKARINKQTDEVEYEFSYSGMVNEVRQAHIHLGQRGVNGGIMVWLCQSAANPAPAAVAATTPLCTNGDHTSSGVITAVSVVGPGGPQQLAAGEMAEFLAALRAGVAYVNVHTVVSPGGEIRGQIGHQH